MGTGPLEIHEGGRFYYGYDQRLTLTNPITVVNGKIDGWNNLHYLIAPNGIRIKGDLELYTKANPQGLQAPLRDYDGTHTGRVVKTGNGIFYWERAMTNCSYSGGTRIEEGAIGITYLTDNAFGTGPIEVLPGGKLTMLNNNTQTNLIILNGGEISTRIGNPYTTLPNVLIKGVGIISSASPNYFSLTTSLHDFGAETPGHLIISNNSVASPIRLYGTHTYSGGTHLKKGLLRSSSNLPDTGMIQVDAESIMEFTTTSDTIGGLGGTGSIILGVATITCNEGISPGSNALSGGTLSITGSTGRVVLGAEAVSTFHLREPGDQDQVVLQGGAELTLGGELRIEALDGLIPGEYTLFELADGAPPEGTFSELVLPDNFMGSVKTIGNDVVLRLAAPGTIMIIK